MSSITETMLDQHQYFCPKCRRLLPLSRFYWYNSGRRSGYCKKCTSKINAERTRQRRKDPAFRARENARLAARAKERYHTDPTFRARELKRHRRPLPQVCANCGKYPCFEGIDSMSSNLALTCHSYNER